MANLRVSCFLQILHESSCCFAVCVGLPRCQIWDSHPRLLRLQKCGAWKHGIDRFQWMSCMAHSDAKLGWQGHRLTTSWVCTGIGMAILKILSQKKGNWKPCKAASSPGCSVHFTVLGQSSHTTGERFLHQRFDLLPDVCLVLGHRVIAFHDHSDRNARPCYCWNS